MPAGGMSGFNWNARQRTVTGASGPQVQRLLQSLLADEAPGADRVGENVDNHEVAPCRRLQIVVREPSVPEPSPVLSASH